jgi:hypothetical protein
MESSENECAMNAFESERNVVPEMEVDPPESAYRG